MAQEITVGLCTSGSRIKTALYAGGKFSSLSKKEPNQEKFLLPMVKILLKKRGAQLKDISSVCVVSGPGRFTGLRIALAFAATLKTLAGVKVFSATLFDILAAQASASRRFRIWAEGKKNPRVAALVHAFKDEYFCQAFEVIKKKAAGCQSAKSPDCRLPGRQTDDWGRRPLATGYKFAAIEAPRWLKEAETAGYLKAHGRELYVAADAEERPDIYKLIPAGFEKAPASVSRIIPEFIIKAGLALKNTDLRPLYLKPARYEIEKADIQFSSSSLRKQGSR